MLQEIKSYLLFLENNSETKETLATSKACQHPSNNDGHNIRCQSNSCPSDDAGDEADFNCVQPANGLHKESRQNAPEGHGNDDNGSDPRGFCCGGVDVCVVTLELWNDNSGECQRDPDDYVK